jgi:HAD superfamily hydrolase (TIGR01509 family)
MTTNTGIIFDMDGTIVNNIPFHKDAWLLFLKSNNIPIDEKDFNVPNHGTIDEMIIRFFGTDLPAEKIKELGEEKERIYRNLYQSQIREISGLSECLNRLRHNNIYIGLATMGDMPNIDFIIDNLDIRKYFHTVIGGHEVSKGKPDPEIFLTAMKKLRVDNKNCIAVEDSIGGVRAALGAGLKVVGITTTFTKEELLDNGCFQTVDNYLNFNEIIGEELSTS